MNACAAPSAAVDRLERARTWVARPVAAAAPGADDAPALAWALKDLGYAAWNSDPAYTRRVAHAAACWAALAPPSAQAEASAVATWLGGVADLTEGRMEEAAARFDVAAAALRAIGLHAAAAQTRVPKMVALSMLGRHAEAAACGDAAEQALREAGDRLAAGKVNLNLGNLHVRCNAYAEALQRYRRAAVLFARAGDREHSVMADIGAADARAALGQFDDALVLYARAGQRAAAHRLPVLAALAVESAALVHLSRGAYRDALAGLDDARRRYERLDLPTHRATAEKQLADTYLELHLLPEAIALFSAALAAFERLQMPVEAAWAQVQRARALALAGRPQAEVALDARAAQDAFARLGVPLGLASTRLVDAEQALAAGASAPALAAARAAAQDFAAADAADGVLRAELVVARALLAQGDTAAAHAAAAQVAHRARTVGASAAAAQAHAVLGRAAWLQGDVGAAERALRVAVDALELQRRTLPDDTLRHAFLADELGPYQGLLRLALARGDAAGTVLQRLEAFRARTLDDRLRSAAAPIADATARALRERLDWLYRRALREREEGRAGAWSEVRALERELAEHLRRERIAAPGALAGPAPDALDLAALRARLAAADALVEYGALDDELFAVVVRRDGETLVRRLASWREAQAGVQALRLQIDGLRLGAADRHLGQRIERATRRGQALHAQLWAPLAAALAGVQRVLVVPHGALAGLPFAALHDGVAPLGAQLTLASAPSARAALHGLERVPPTAPRRALALGDSQRLPHSGPEAQAVARAYADGVACIDADATLERLRAHGGRAEVLHLACHGEFRADNPGFSLLHLADGALTVEAAAGLALERSIVVLGACDSAAAGAGSGDEAVGFVRAFLEAGAARVVASLWPLADAAAAAPMAALHAALARGVAPAAALREVQGRLREAQPHPFHWAALTVHGGW